MNVGQCRMTSEQAPPGFWTGADDRSALVGGVEFESAVPTRFFQQLDAFPRAWGRLSWRLQLNRVVAGRAEPPSFRTFYPGVEWNLRQPGGRWFLSAWFRWEDGAPPCRDAAVPPAIRIDGETVLFRFAWLPAPGSAEVPDPERPLFLRSRIDARSRRSVAAAVRAEREPPPKPDPGLIVLDDVLGPSG
ncbi:MAG: hypothetical protein JO036_02385 [Candidatus Eremiobacteraeota bacterium]|nr:hypothetical protein [Candidatus Eremiobacteraeota bacterium]